MRIILHYKNAVFICAFLALSVVNLTTKCTEIGTQRAQRQILLDNLFNKIDF